MSETNASSAGTVTACRRVLDRHPTSGALWWLASRRYHQERLAIAA